MIALSPHPQIDDTIHEALARMRCRRGALGEAFDALIDASDRAARGGKRFRPALVVAAFESLGGDLAAAPGVFPVAAAFELLHTAFVVHDDVIDHDTVRRGIPNVAGEFRHRAENQGADAAGAALLGDAAAILAGDLLLHEAFRLIALAPVDLPTRVRLMELLDEAMYVSAAGELADVENSVIDDAPHHAVLDAAYNKTAVYSFSAPLCAGAALAGASPEVTGLLERAGGQLGLAFQFVDDLIGAFGTDDQAGRASGGDLREGKRTPLVSLARESATWAQVNDAIAVAHTGPIAVQEAQRILEASGARAQMRALVDGALLEVRTASADPALPASAGVLLRALADGVESRIP